MSNKVYVLPPGENWIIDRFVKEWNEDNSDICALHPKQADVIWLLADFCWRRLADASLLDGKKIITTIHHIVPEKFGIHERMDFQLRDNITTVYHVQNKHTEAFIRPLTRKPIRTIPYWANNSIFKLAVRDTIPGASTSSLAVKQLLRKKYKLPEDSYLVGSFQRDTEGAGIPQGIFLPKMEKGPDLLADYFEHLHEERPDLHVVLAGWRRQYIIDRLRSSNIPYTYIELPSHEVINELYQTLDLYPVTARQEGGPQSLIECGLLNVACVSRDIGIAYQLLPATAISDDITKAIPAIPSVNHMLLPKGYNAYRKLIASL